MSSVRTLEQKFDPKKYEEEILEFWEKEKIYDKVRASLQGKPKFYFLDGPPYPSSDTPHIGTIWNKVLKDSIIRFRRAQGYDVHDQPGYDCHGLPIEVKVEQMFGFKTKKDIENYGVDNFVKACEEFALKNVKAMTEHFKNFGVSMDWEKPYLTLNRDYMESAWWLIKRADENGLLEKGVKVVHWCPRCETTLADYEITEYRELEDPSIYVKFPVKGEKNKYIVIWTTTPWTLPANVAVMAHPDLEYVWVEVDGEELLLAKDRLEAVMSEAGIKNFKVKRTVKGSELEGLEYEHPLVEEVDVQKKLVDVHRIVLSSEFVSAEEGTGLVHAAPGHGEEDFIVGKRYGLPVISPVNDQGIFTEEAGKYKGLRVREANDLIIEDLKRKGYLFYATKFRHRYPVCWRCKTPLIMRATPQWYIRVTHLKNRFLEEALKVKWIPEWAGYARFKNWLEGLRDWIVSRQRYWGTPLPVWVCEKCGHRVVVGSVKELEKLVGKKLELKDLHRPWIDNIKFKCPKCGGEMKRVPDVLDVWLDSGVAFYASLGYPQRRELFEKLWPVDFITEGHDQIAGWFFSLLRCGLITMDTSPYRTVLMHGFALDEKGREMHKSLGNYVAPQEVLKFDKGSRDVLRWFVLKNTIWEDLRFSWNGLAQVYDDLHLIWNVYYFATLYMGLDKFDPRKYTLEQLENHLRKEDKWMLSRIENIVKEATKYFEEYHIHKAARLLRDFITEDVSRWYVKLVRPRVWVEKDDPDKLVAYATLYYVLKRFLQLLSPIAPFITEKIYRDSFRTDEEPESIHMLPWPKPREEFIDIELEKAMEIVKDVVEKALATRMKAGIKIRQPLPTLYVITGSPEIKGSVELLENVVKTQVNVKEIKVVGLEELSKFIDIVVKPVYKVLGPKFKKDAGKIIAKLGEINGYEVRTALEKDGKYVLKIEEAEFEITSDMVEFEEKFKEGFEGVPYGDGYVVLDTKISEKELAEGLARDILRRIQFMRKELNLPVDAFIETVVYVPENYREMLQEFVDYLKNESRSKSLTFVHKEEEVKGINIKDWEIGDIKVRIGIRLTD
ncbi:MAG: isoleucine--tRNA ligase [Thermoprotei archaeon]|nr:MAG: isoleucine--tRNA ligase [Thermoprotei archaeon]